MEKGFKMIGIVEIGNYLYCLLQEALLYTPIPIDHCLCIVSSNFCPMCNALSCLMRVVFQAVSCKFVCFYFFNLPILTCIFQGVYRKKGTRTSSCSVCTDSPGQLSALCLDDWLISTSPFPLQSCVCVCVCVYVCMLGSSPFTVWFPLYPNTIKPDTWISVMVAYCLYISWLSQLQENPSKVSWAFLECGWPQGPHLGMVWKIRIGWLVHPCRSTTRNIFSHIPMYPAWFILVFNYNLSF